MFNDLSKQWDLIEKNVKPRFENLFETSHFIGGEDVNKFEKNFANYCGSKYAVGVSNGTDALKIALASFNLKSPCGIIIPANTFIATALAASYIPDLSSKLVLVDCDKYYQIDTDLLERCLKKNRKKWSSCVIIPVHLYGHPANMQRILEIAEEYNCYILEDSSQAHGAETMNKKVGVFGDASAFSLYPGKNLGAAGDAGVITTNNHEIYQKLKSLRNYGSTKKYYYDFKGWNNRLDSIQAIIVDEKLKYLDDWNKKRIQIAQKYDNLLKDNENISLPEKAPYADKYIYHIYAIRVKDRDKLQKHLTANNVPTIIHYPIPIEKTKPFEHLGRFNNIKTKEYAKELISLPMHPFLSNNQIKYIAKTITDFF